MKLEQGTFVKVLEGAFKDTVGVIEDVQDECSAVRIGTREGNAFAMIDAVKVLPYRDTDTQPMRAVRSPLRRK